MTCTQMNKNAYGQIMSIPPILPHWHSGLCNNKNAYGQMMLIPSILPHWSLQQQECVWPNNINSINSATLAYWSCNNKNAYGQITSIPSILPHWHSGLHSNKKKVQKGQDHAVTACNFNLVTLPIPGSRDYPSHKRGSTMLNWSTTHNSHRF